MRNSRDFDYLSQDSAHYRRVFIFEAHRDDGRAVVGIFIQNFASVDTESKNLSCHVWTSNPFMQSEKISLDRLWKNIVDSNNDKLLNKEELEDLQIRFEALNVVKHQVCKQ